MKIVTDKDYMHVRCREVTEDDPVAETAELLIKGLKEYDAFGLAANQLGIRLRMFAMRMDPYSPVCVVNPVIVKKKGLDTRDERCLSADTTVKVERPREVVVKGVNQYFKPVKYRLTGLSAHVVCHEIDHLNGKLITDEFERVKSKLLDRAKRLSQDAKGGEE